jgi:hypothetical protein
MDGMTGILQFVLSALCAGLSLIVVAEVFSLTQQNYSSVAETATPTTALVETVAPAPDMDGTVAAILARPLFTPGRRPPQTASFAPIAETEEEAPRQLRGRLAGVTIRPGVREALFIREGQKPLAVSVGAEIDGWRISAIEPDRVILSSASGDQTIKPTNDPEAVRQRVRRIVTGIGAAPSADSSAPTAGGTSPKPAAAAVLRATPNPVVTPLLLARRAGGRGPR